MNWKQGLTRIFVVLWVAWGLGLGAVAVTETVGVWDEARHRSVRVSSGVVYRFPSKVTDHEVSVFLESTADSFWDSPGVYAVPNQEPVNITGQMLTRALESLPRPRTVRAALLGRTWEPLARSAEARAPWRFTFKVLGQWLGLCGVAPAVLLLTIRWVWTGFVPRKA